MLAFFEKKNAAYKEQKYFRARIANNTGGERSVGGNNRGEKVQPGLAA